MTSHRMNDRIAATVGAVVLGAAMMVPVGASGPSIASVEVVASGLDNPRGLAIGPDGAVYVAEAGRGGDGPCITSSEPRVVCYGATGAITRIGAFSVFRVVTRLPSLAPAPGQPGAGMGAGGVTHIAFDENRHAIGITGLGADPAKRALLGPVGARFGRLLRFGLFNQVSFEDDVAAYEVDANPDGGAIDSNPYGLAVVGSDIVVADAGANAVLNVTRGVSIATVAAFPRRLVPFGPPGNMIPMQAVPTAVVQGPDQALYVGQLTGFPFPIGGANVYRIAPGGSPEVYASGFTNIIDLAFGRDGSLYVLQISANGLPSGNPLGALIRVAPDGTRTPLAPGALISPGGLAIARDGSIYVTRFATLPGAGDVVRIRQ